MTTSSGELIEILRTLTQADCAPAVALAQRLAAMEGTSISKNKGPIPTGQLKDIYSFRASNPRLPRARAQDFERLARIAGLFPLEHWYLSVLSHGLHKLSIFANERGVGRFCLDLTTHSVMVALPMSWGLELLAKCLASDDNGCLETLKSVENALVASTRDGIWLVLEEVPVPELTRGHNYRSGYRSEPSIDEQFRRDISSLRLFRIRFNVIHLVRRLLRCVSQEIVSNDDMAWIDAENGSVISARDFLAKTDQNPDWDWRSPPSRDWK